METCRAVSAFTLGELLRGLGLPACLLSLLDRVFWHLSSAMGGKITTYKHLILKVPGSQFLTFHC